MSAGTIPISMTQQFDIYGMPLAGGQLYIILAGTVSTPQDAFADVGLTIKQPYPMTLDAAGRVPQFFLDNAINAGVKIRLQDKSGVVQLASDFVLIIGPAGGTGGGGGGLAGEPSQLFVTGDLKARYAIGIHPGVEPGWVICNGLSIGNVGSTASQRPAAVCQNLFQFLWPYSDPSVPANSRLTIGNGARGASAAVDWGAGRTITTPDYRGFALAALTDMGNTPSANLTTAFFGTDPTILGASGGTQNQTIAQNQLPNIVPTFTGTDAIYTVQTGGANGGKMLTGDLAGTQTAQTGGGTGTLTGTNFASGIIASSGHNTPAGTISSINGNVSPSPVITVQPTKLCTIYIKL